MIVLVIVMIMEVISNTAKVVLVVMTNADLIIMMDVVGVVATDNHP